MTKNASAGRWRKGESGNPAGRPPGTGDVARLRAAISAHVPAIVTKLVTQAKAGDVAAARLLLERAVPPLRAAESAVELQLPEGSLADQGRAVLAALSSGGLEPTQAAQVLNGLGMLAKLVEATELESRISRLERRKDA